MGGIPQAAAAVQHGTEIVAVSLHRLSGVNPHPHPNRLTFDCQSVRARCASTAALTASLNIVKRRRQRVAGGGENMTAMGGDRLHAEAGRVRPEPRSCASRMGVPQTARSLDVGKEKGHHSRGR